VAGRDAPLEVGSVILKHLNRHRRVVQHATVYAEVGATSKNMQPDSPSSSTSKEGPEKETGAYRTASPERCSTSPHPQAEVTLREAGPWRGGRPSKKPHPRAGFPPPPVAGAYLVKVLEDRLNNPNSSAVFVAFKAMAEGLVDAVMNEVFFSLA